MILKFLSPDSYHMILEALGEKFQEVKPSKLLASQEKERENDQFSQARIEAHNWACTFQDL